MHCAAGGEVPTGAGESADSKATDVRSPHLQWTRWRMHRRTMPPAGGHTAPSFFDGKRPLSRPSVPSFCRKSFVAAYQLYVEQRMRENLHLTGPHAALALPHRRRSSLICMSRTVH